MKIINITQTGSDFIYRWPGSDQQQYPSWILYKVLDDDKTHDVRIGFTIQKQYDEKRIHCVVWIDNHPQSELFGADDYEISGDVLSEIRIKRNGSMVMCNYNNDSVPKRYSSFNTVGLPTRINKKGVHNAWSVLINISNHQKMIELAWLRREERLK